MSPLTPSRRPIYLSHDDPEPQERSRALVEKRATYRYDHDLAGLALASETPKGEGFGAIYLASVGVLEAQIKLAEARAASDLGASLLGGLAIPERRPTAIDEYAALLAHLGRPGSMARWRDDWYFAWQRLAGSTPMLLRHAPEPQDRFPITAEAYAAATGDRDSLDAARAEGRLFVVDYPALQGMRASALEGAQKYPSSPVAMFVLLPGEGGPRERFVPIGIQCTPEPIDDARIWTPRDGVRWQMARYVVQCAETWVHESVLHTGVGHMVAEATLLATHHELAPNHPLHIFLKPHFEFTLATNHVARTSFLNPGGFTERLTPAPLEDSLALIRRTVDDTRIDQIAPRDDLAARGVLSEEVLPFYPYREDALQVYDAIWSWTNDYLRLYYHGPSDLEHDAEVHAWRDALASPHQFRLQGVPALNAVEDLVGLVANLLWCTCAVHACTNYSGWEFSAWPANMSTAAYGPAPTLSREPDEADLLAMMPPLHVAWEIATVMFKLRNITDNSLRDDLSEYFAQDSRVGPLYERHLRTLEETRADIDRRNANTLLRPNPYPYLRPDLINRSIHA